MPYIKLNSTGFILGDIDPNFADVASVLILDDSVLISGTVGYLLQDDITKNVIVPGQGFVAVLKQSDGSIVGINRYGNKDRNSWVYQLERARPSTGLKRLNLLMILLFSSGPD